MRRPSLADSARSTSSLARRVRFTSAASLAAKRVEEAREREMWRCLETNFNNKGSVTEEP